MKVAVQLMYEDGGRPVPRWRENLERTKVVTGDFTFKTELVREFRTHMGVAKLVRDDGGDPLQLFRAELLYVSGDFLTVAGLEHDHMHNRYTAQTWCLQIVASE